MDPFECGVWNADCGIAPECWPGPEAAAGNETEACNLRPEVPAEAESRNPIATKRDINSLNDKTTEPR